MVAGSFEGLRDVPLFEEMLATLKEGKDFRAELGESDFKSVMDQLMKVMLGSPDFQKLGIKLSKQPYTEVAIDPANLGKFNGRVWIASPMALDIQLWTQFKNGQKANEIALAQCVTKTNGGDPLGIVAGKIDSGIKGALQSPNYAMFNAMKTVMTPNGIELTGISLQFANQKLNFGLGGKPVQK